LERYLTGQANGKTEHSPTIEGKLWRTATIEDFERSFARTGVQEAEIEPAVWERRKD
jgi:hypothetical protein